MNTLELDKGTFGNSKAAIDLIKILNDNYNEAVNRKVSKILSSYFDGVKDLRNLKTHKFKISSMWRDQYIKKTKEFNFDYSIESRIRNLIIAKFRDLNYR